MSTAIKTTLLYERLPKINEDALRTDLRVLAGKHGLPVSGQSDLSNGQLLLECLPYEIVIQPMESMLSASAFTGALSGNQRPSQRESLAKTVSDHKAHIQVSVRDTGKSHGVREVIQPTSHIGILDMRRASIFAQDVNRLLIQHLPPMALHYHQSNQLALPGVLPTADYGRLQLPLCLRLSCTSAPLSDTVVVNMAQSVDGAEAFLGRPLHVMSLSLNRFETMQLAVAFLDRMLEGEARPIAGAIFRDQRGTRMQVIEMPPSEDQPNGLIALVEIQDSKSGQPGLSKTVTTAREQVAYRAKGRVKSRDLNLAQKLANLRSNQTPVQKDETVLSTEITETEGDSSGLPSGEELAALRQRTASPHSQG